MLLLTLDVSADTAELQAPPRRQSDANIMGHVVDAARANTWPMPP